jgi:hypothetical protein
MGPLDNASVQALALYIEIQIFLIKKDIQVLLLSAYQSNNAMAPFILLKGAVAYIRFANHIALCYHRLSGNEKQ